MLNILKVSRMKKLLNIFILTLCMLIAGCDNDDSSVSVLKVINQT